MVEYTNKLTPSKGKVYEVELLHTNKIFQEKPKHSVCPATALYSNFIMKL